MQMQKTAELIQEALDDTQHCFVFPSEVSAVFWRRHMLSAGGRRSLRNGRFISWDTFKEELFDSRHSERPVNAVLRRIFTHNLLSENAGEPFLSYLINPEYAENSRTFVSYVQRILPQLSALAEETGILNESGDGTYIDFRIIYDRYRNFLHENGLFEPGWDTLLPRDITKKYTVFFPEILEDYNEYAALLKAAGKISIVPVPDSVPGTLHVFGNQVQEIRLVLSKIEALLDSGVPPQAIVITAGALESLRDQLSLYADLYSVPLSIREGRPLSEYVGASFFTRLGDWISGNLDLDSLKALLLNKAIPWRNPGLLREISAFAVEKNCSRGYFEDGVFYDLVEETARAAYKNPYPSRYSPPISLSPDALSWYRAFRTESRRLVSAGSAAELKKTVQIMLNRYINPEGWDEENEKILQQALDVLNELAYSESILKSPLPAPFELWTSILADRIYVARDISAAVAVYPYRVSAGIFPEYHFLLNISHQASSWTRSRLDFLRDDYRKKLGLESRDFSAAFLSLYTRSGRDVRVGCSLDSFSGPALPPSWYIAGGTIEYEEGGGRRGSDVFPGETALWGGETAERPAYVYPAQIEGLQYMDSTGFRSKGFDAGGKSLPESPLKTRLTLLQEDKEGSGHLRLSASHLESYDRCRFAYLFERCLRLREGQFETDFDDPQALGNVYHIILEHLYRRISDEDGLIRDAHHTRYRELLYSVCEDIFTAWLPVYTSFIPPVRAALRPRVQSALEEFLSIDLKKSAGCRVRALEAWYEAEAADEEGTAGDFILYGKVDRVLENIESAALRLLDYKKNKLPVKKTITGDGDDFDVISSYQIPVYLYLLASQGADIEEAAFYSVESAKFALVYGGSSAWIDDERKQAVVEHLLVKAASVVRSIRSGDYRLPEAEEECSGCPYRGLCRMKYTVDCE